MRNWNDTFDAFESSADDAAMVIVKLSDTAWTLSPAAGALASADKREGVSWSKAETLPYDTASDEAEYHGEMCDCLACFAVDAMLYRIVERVYAAPRDPRKADEPSMVYAALLGAATGGAYALAMLPLVVMLARLMR